MEALNQYAPLMNMVILVALSYLAVRAKKTDKKDQEFKIVLLSAVDAKLTAFEASFLKELREEFVPIGSCMLIHKQLENLADIPERVVRLETWREAENEQNSDT